MNWWLTVTGEMMRSRKAHRNEKGFSVIELVMVLLMSLIAAAFAVPQIQPILNYYRLRSAVASATWAIQSTRFQALEEGYPYQVSFTGGTAGVNPSYQIANKVLGATTYTNLGEAVPLSGSPVVLGATTVFQFQPNGVVATSPVTSPPFAFTITYGGNTETLTVSNYGNVTVTP